MGNKLTIIVGEIGNYKLLLSSGLFMVLLSSWYFLDMEINIISCHASYGIVFDFGFNNELKLVYKNDVLYLKVKPYHGIYEIIIVV